MNFLRPDRRFLAALAALALLAAFIIPNVSAGILPNGAFEWLQTPSAVARTAAGECYDPQATVQDVCVQFCIVSIDGDVMPQNQYACMPFAN